MLTKLSQQQLEVIRGKYIQQNKSLAQQNSMLLMKCNALENKITELLKENMHMKNSKIDIENDLKRLETIVDGKLREILGCVEGFKTKAEIAVRVPKVVIPARKVFQILHDSIPELEEEGNISNPIVLEQEGNITNLIVLEQEESIPDQMERAVVEEEKISNPIVVEEEVEDSLVEVEQCKLVIPKEKKEKKEESQQRIESAEVESDLITDIPRPKRRRKSSVNYKLPSLKHKMRRTGEKWVDAVYDKDDLITVDKRRDSFGNWLDDETVSVVQPSSKDVSVSAVQPSSKDVSVSVVQPSPTDVSVSVVQPSSQDVSVGKGIDKENVDLQTKVQPKLYKKPLGDITNRQNMGPNVKKDGGDKKLKSIANDLSIFDFIEEDNLERKTIFNKRRNSII